MSNHQRQISFAILRLTAWLILICTFYINAQASIPAPDSLRLKKSLENAVSLFHKMNGEQSNLYTGRAHEPYLADISGSPYFESEQWERGSIVFDNVLYTDIPMLYDQVIDELVILHPEKETGIVLVKSRIQGFTLFGHTFANIQTEEGSGNVFYDLLAEGQISVYVKRKKLLDEKIAAGGFQRQFIGEDQYFLKKGDDFSLIRSISALYKLLNDEKDEIRGLVKTRKLNYKSNPEVTLEEIARYYNSKVSLE